ncbi:hypothetical protein LZF95_04365 [Algoriphagus sp. AGSA1]|uniref:hypothetical protein n=1 Tax=Algoriphagus sp. AGSA1 TaxID=2907213 RepID=UPI001F1A27F4|nr:hypothetical protein [Algoriphagus sp. AGSA1]MCE7053902.1 hypothetical protein [Algoriphagus sp. AGSA1]
MDYSSLIKKCSKVSNFSEPVLNDLMYYAAERNKLDQRFDLLVKKHKNVFGRLGKANQAMFKTQYVIHELFKNEGLIHKYLNHAHIKALPKEEYEYLKAQAANPWRFTYWFVRTNPYPDFFESVDIITGEEFLLYSPGASRTLGEQNVLTFGGLISSNGDCYQTYGPLMGFSSFQADDIFFYAGELDPTIETIEELTELIEKDLFSFLLLSVYSAIPMVQHQGHEILYVLSTIDATAFEMDLWKDAFRVEYSADVFKMSLKELEAFPHYACVYFDELQEEMTITAMTDFGYDRLAGELNRMGIDAPAEPYIRLHVSMKSAIEEITGHDTELLPHEGLFSQVSPEQEDSPELDAINKFLAELMPAINSRTKFDLDELITRTGADPDAAKDIYKDLMKKLNR